MIAFFNKQLIFADGYPQLAAKYFKFLVISAVEGCVELRPAPVLAFEYLPAAQGPEHKGFSPPPAP